MEAASARASDRFSAGGWGEAPRTPLQRYIMQACDPQNFEPNLALNLEIADLINAKKGNAPREAAVAIVNYVNHRNQNVAMFALNLLDICVKNCGYPFHLQISTKDFLNELVRRFPERPPIHPTRVQNKILGLIEEWRSTICQTSRYKEDLGFVRDMHRLLSSKGYMFPEVRREDAAVLNPSEALRSAEEMEEEERVAQSAKLQELIRRGTPHDLQEANRLMKVMAGYYPWHKTDYRAKAAEEVGKIQQKAKLLEEMLQRYKEGEKLNEGDVYEELAAALQSAQPKIQKMCEEESDDHEAVAKLFEINDSIHRTIERYKLIKKGDVAGANKIPVGTLGTSGAGVSQGPGNELSLIDLGGPEDVPALSSQNANSAPAPKGNALEDDLLGLSIGDSPFGQGGGISLGPSNGISSLLPTQTGMQQQAPQSRIPSFNPQQSSLSQPGPPKPNYNPFGTSNSHQGSSLSPPPSAPITSNPIRSISAADPFAALTSAGSSRTASPFQFHQSIQQPPIASSSELIGLGSAPSAPAAAPAQQSAAAAPADDEWTFASNVPDQPQDIAVANSNINVTWNVHRQDEHSLVIVSRVSNNTFQPVSELTFQVAVSKGFTLKLEPQSGRTLSPKQVHGVTQTIRVLGVDRGKGSQIKMRWKATYVVGSERKDEQGEVASLGVS